MEALQTEIEILKRVDHPNIIKLIDTFEDHRHFCLVMELIQGGELFDQILQKEQFSENEAREALMQIIDAIEYCHSLEILHRDIKPENLLLETKDTSMMSLKIADFGLARVLDTDSLASTTCGTPGYVAPEVLQQQPYGKECDIWSIGVVLFILLSGTPPFYEEDNFKLFEQIKSCKYDFDVDTWDNVSAEAKDFVSKILVADPKKRMTIPDMKLHAWMNKVLVNDQKLDKVKTKLFKYVSIRKEKSQNFKKS